MSKKKKLKIKIKIEATTKEIAKLLRDIELEFSSNSDITSCSDGDLDSKEAEVDESTIASAACKKWREYIKPGNTTPKVVFQRPILEDNANETNTTNPGITATFTEHLYASNFKCIEPSPDGVLPIDEIYKDIMSFSEDERSRSSVEDGFFATFNLIRKEYEELLHPVNDDLVHKENPLAYYTDQRFKESAFAHAILHMCKYLVSHFKIDDNKTKVFELERYTPRVVLVKTNEENGGIDAYMEQNDGTRVNGVIDLSNACQDIRVSVVEAKAKEFYKYLNESDTVSE